MELAYLIDAEAVLALQEALGESNPKTALEEAITFMLDARKQADKVDAEWAELMAEPA